MLRNRGTHVSRPEDIDVGACRATGQELHVVFDGWVTVKQHFFTPLYHPLMSSTQLALPGPISDRGAPNRPSPISIVTYHSVTTPMVSGTTAPAPSAVGGPSATATVNALPEHPNDRTVTASSKGSEVPPAMQRSGVAVRPTQQPARAANTVDITLNAASRPDLAKVVKPAVVRRSADDVQRWRRELVRDPVRELAGRDPVVAAGMSPPVPEGPHPFALPFPVDRLRRRNFTEYWLVTHDDTKQPAAETSSLTAQRRDPVSGDPVCSPLPLDPVTVDDPANRAQGSSSYLHEWVASHGNGAPSPDDHAMPRSKERYTAAETAARRRLGAWVAESTDHTVPRVLRRTLPLPGVFFAS